MLAEIMKSYYNSMLVRTMKTPQKNQINNIKKKTNIHGEFDFNATSAQKIYNCNLEALPYFKDFIFNL